MACLTWCNLWAERQFKEVEHLFQLFSRLVAAWWKLTTIYQTMNGIYIHITSNVLQTFDWSRSNNTKMLFYSQIASTHWSMQRRKYCNMVVAFCNTTVYSSQLRIICIIIIIIKSNVRRAFLKMTTLSECPLFVLNNELDMGTLDESVYQYHLI